MAELFSRLRPFCVKLAQQPSVASACSLKEALQALIEPQIPHELFEYILFPLLLILRSQRTSELLILTALDCLRLVLQKTSVRKEAVVTDLITQLCAKATGLRSAKHEDEDQANVILENSSVSEEIRLACISCVTTLLESTSLSVRQSLYSLERAPVLGYAVSVTLQLTTVETMRPLQIESMKCLQSLCWCSSHELDAVPVDVQPISDGARQCCQVVASFLPGIVTSIAKVIVGDSKQGQAVLSMAFLTWSSVVAAAMCDALMPADISIDMHDEYQNEETEKRKALVTNQDRRWWKVTASKVQQLLKRILSVGIHSEWKLRLSVCKFAKMLLLKCNKSLENCVPMLVDVLVSHLNDDYKQVAEFSKQSLDCFSEIVVAQGSGSLISMFVENIHLLITRLPRIIRTADDAQRLPTLELLVGYLRLLGPRISSLLSSSSHLKRLSRALLQILELVPSDLRIMEEQNLQFGLTANSMLHCPVANHSFGHSIYKLRFCHFNDEKIQTTVVKSIRLLGYYGDIALLIDHFVEFISPLSLMKKQAILIVNELVRGTAIIGFGCGQDEFLHCKVNSEQTVEQHIRFLLAEYVRESNWNIPTTVDTRMEDLRANQSSHFLSSASGDGLTVQTLNSNTMFICLLLDGIAAFAEVLGKQFDTLLITALYPIMEKLGDSKGVISQTALNTLMVICQSCGYRLCDFGVVAVCLLYVWCICSSVSSVIGRNADYLIDTVSLNLRHLDMNPTTARVLKVMFQQSDETFLPLVDDTLHEVFSCLDGHFDETALLLMPVLQSLIEAVCRWFCNTGKQTATNSRVEGFSSEDSNMKGCSVSQYLLQYCKKQEVEETDNVENNQDDESNEQDEDADEIDYSEDKQEPTAAHVLLTVEVLERCTHYVSSKNARLRLMVLSVIQNGLAILNPATDQLLPQVHKLWSPLVRRLNDVEPIVLIKALDVLCTMAEVSGDFIRRRVAADVWPSLSKTLEGLTGVSLQAGTSYKHTVNFKLQRAILTTVTVLISKLDMGDVELSNIAASALLYLNMKQPGELQEAALGLFKTLAGVDSDATWLILSEVVGCCLPSPHPCFSSIKLGTGSRFRGIQFPEVVLDMFDGLSSPGFS
ncbi:TELO2-interacting protein 1 homolog isoform X2 [Corticium candelabrum]|uniref:TELO2-interacting protein 1 homolog isoform X2 n=1 Tax=Corticium candelabrum TaxID=121492 RepID=UPI002E26F8A1|nr:TELO2-interacting protein 1 homolog isoform X2 [Corticium candelabrum]